MPITKYFDNDSVPFTNPIKLGSPFKVFEKCDRKLVGLSESFASIKN
jgi:hypothetical protein